MLFYWLLIEVTSEWRLTLVIGETVLYFNAQHEELSSEMCDHQSLKGVFYSFLPVFEFPISIKAYFIGHKV